MVQVQAIIQMIGNSARDCRFMRLQCHSIYHRVPATARGSSSSSYIYKFVWLCSSDTLLLRYVGHGKCGNQASFRLKLHVTDIRFHHEGIYNWAAEIVGPCTTMHTVQPHRSKLWGHSTRIMGWHHRVTDDFQGYPCIEARIGSEILSPGCSLLCSLTGPTIIVDSIDIFLYFRAIQLHRNHHFSVKGSPNMGKYKDLYAMRTTAICGMQIAFFTFARIAIKDGNYHMSLKMLGKDASIKWGSQWAGSSIPHRFSSVCLRCEGIDIST